MNAQRVALPLVYGFFLALIAYLAFNTGVVSDDFAHIDCLRGKDITDVICMRDPGWLLLPVEHYLLLVWYRLIQVDHLFFLNLLKTGYLFLSFCLVAKFFSLYLEKADAFTASFLFVFFPAHDATAYWFLGYYLTLSVAFYLYAFYLLETGKTALAFTVATAASFISYGSPVIAFALFVLCSLGNKAWKGLVLLVPNVLFIGYYLFMGKVVLAGGVKLPSCFSVISFVKNLVMQIGTFIDSMVGPSMGLKIFWSFPQLSVLSAVVATVAVIAFCRPRKAPVRLDPRLVVGLTVLAFSSFALFALTGQYPQMAFNLGNRVTIFGSLLVVYLIVAMPLPLRVRYTLIAVLVVAAVGISDHWKGWNAHQQRVFENIRNNAALRAYDPSQPLYVSGNQYSPYGPLGHIEFFSEESTTGPFFSLALRRDRVLATPLNRRFVHEEGRLTDTKYGTAREVGRYLQVYDSARDAFFTLEPDRIDGYIASLPPDRRHWVQIVPCGFIRDVCARLMPRLKYGLVP